MRIFIVWLLLAATVLALTGSAGPYQVELTTDPAVVPVGTADLIIRVTDSSGKQVEGATVRTLAKMPTMDMGEREQVARPAGEPGVYRAPAGFSMAGGYVVRITIVSHHGEGTGEFQLSTGDTTTTGRSLPWKPVGGLLALALMSLAAFRLYKAGHLTRPVLGGLLLLAVMLAGAVYAVKHFRRPGAMTPIEAQVMEMNMPAPPGTVAVEVEEVKRGKIDVSVSYAGQVAAYQEQTIYPRTEGIVEWMPLYVGDRVRKGQVVARLDVTRLLPEQREREAGTQESARAVDVARSEEDQARAEVELAEAERDERTAAVTAARAKADQASARAEAARAQTRYQREEVRRSRELAAAGGLSQEDLQRDEAEAVEAEEKLSEAFSEVEAARADVRAAKSQEAAHHAHVKSVQATLDTRRHQVEQAEASLASSRARLASAQAQLDYAEVKSSLDGVVTARRISPGTLVQPGQALLEVAQIDPIRLQANVSEIDLARIAVDDLVRVTDARGRTIEARVTSVAPAVDATTRLGVVEAVARNREERFLPGNLVRLHIVTRRLTWALGVPSAAVHESGEERWVWLAVPEGSGHVARRRSVEVGPVSGDTSVIVEGLEPGELVITRGGASLRENDSVAIPLPKTDGLTVRVTESGFEPSQLEVPAGKPVRVTFLRTTDATCGTEVLFPALKLEKKLPLNEPVVIELTPEGPLEFTCGMNMLKGKVVVR